MIATLLKAKADINARGELGLTHLMEAAMSNRIDVVTTLLKAGAHINEKNEFGWTPLMYDARYSKYPEVITTLLEAGADLKVKDIQRKTAFDHAKSNEKLKGTAAYWKLNDALY